MFVSDGQTPQGYSDGDRQHYSFSAHLCPSLLCSACGRNPLSDLAFMCSKENGEPYGLLDRNYEERPLSVMRFSSNAYTSSACSADSVDPS